MEDDSQGVRCGAATRLVRHVLCRARRSGLLIPVPADLVVRRILRSFQP